MYTKESTGSKRPLSLRPAADVGKKGGAVIENKEVREGVCGVRSIFKLQTEFDWSENFSSNGKRNWI